MKIYNNPSPEQWPALCERPQLELEFLDSTVRNILNRVKKSGDSALRELSFQFDKVQLTDLRVTKSEIESAVESTPTILKDAIIQASENIKKFHSAQATPDIKIETMPGVSCWRKSVPIENVGIYIPGGTAPLFSTVLMLGIPAQLAGCSQIVLCSPPDTSGNVHPAILFTAQLIGITEIYKVGGAQAIAAMAYGTETIPAISKIFGPGNQYVTKAKQLISEEGVAIDMPAGPSEVLVYADETSTPAFVAADLLSQAEHGEDSQVILVLTKDTLAKPIQQEIIIQLDALPRKAFATAALEKSRIIVIEAEKDAVSFINAYAPEHLIINTKKPEAIAGSITNAGSVFLGDYTPEAVGDYASGTNHTLPTNGYAKSFSGVSLNSFTKFITFQQLSKEGIKNLGPTVETMAAAELLEGHKRAIRVRLENLGL